MKKFIHQVSFIVIIFTVILLFIGCGNSDKQLASDKQLTIEDFLYDFDYMMQSMEETFPYFGVAERRLGVDIRALGNETRAMIENYPYSLQGLASELDISLEDMPDLDEHIFWSIIQHEFFSYLEGFVHSFALDFRGYNLFQPVLSSSLSPYYTHNNHYAFTNSASQMFYQEQEVIFNTLAEEQVALFQFVFRREPSVAEQSHGFTHNIVNTEIIEEDRIAYLNMSSFMNFSHNTISDTLRRFYRDIQKFEHLIIDIRDNGGGSTDFWRMYIMKPLWAGRSKMPDMPLYAFYRGSKLGKSLAEENLKIEAQYSRYLAETDDLLTVSEIIKANNLPHINEDDLEDLAYGVKFNTSISNIEWRHMRQLGYQDISDYPFDGEIWLLTNENNYSAAALFARHAKEMGFATLVGEQIGGAYATYVANFTLPNTGIIVRWDIDYLTDSYGRALNEFPTTPHHFNRHGIDALETVLQLIEEGSY
ncbi:S41 family peptidase [Serpentinicella alkaliphila]|uniref:Peptidase S41-like protein n=1 Tax=Serpentinicella alkaliphila TaxID=1734049 RepID=A0A4R2T8D8_9FIRM|nr:S41 family peptidase [Serpentinicella alkaliphila]QUH26136.1 hypothetical protein HZR23_10575 [Serpentinicella alkaliphila]TCP93448.1 peptidase S41-like protein [Serpentinicella alkaliphila]